mmetsp:Transcript_26235/g.47290  ORF Transcript_26235/g.47290 Transcript_26235/m.47290 type:complete len:214 (+) Transcript_26235:151-792(+)
MPNPQVVGGEGQGPYGTYPTTPECPRHVCGPEQGAGKEGGGLWRSLLQQSGPLPHVGARSMRRGGDERGLGLVVREPLRVLIAHWPLCVPAAPGLRGVDDRGAEGVRRLLLDGRPNDLAQDWSHLIGHGQCLLRGTLLVHHPTRGQDLVIWPGVHDHHPACVLVQDIGAATIACGGQASPVHAHALRCFVDGDGVSQDCQNGRFDEPRVLNRH